MLAYATGLSLQAWRTPPYSPLLTAPPVPLLRRRGSTSRRPGTASRGRRGVLPHWATEVGTGVHERRSQCITAVSVWWPTSIWQSGSLMSHRVSHDAMEGDQLAILTSALEN